LFGGMARLRMRRFIFGQISSS